MPKQAPRTVCIAVDNSESSVDAFKWATQHFLRPDDHLHVLTVVAPTAKQTFVVGDHAVMLAEPAGPSSDDMELADKVLSQCRSMAEKQGGLHNITTTRMCGVLGRSSEVGNAVNHYAQTHNADVVVVGSRGLGSAARSLLGLVGLGSISDYLVRHSAVPVVVHRGGGE